MKHFLIVIDMQKDFIDGALGSAEAIAIVENAAKKIKAFDGTIFVTQDTHFENYLETAEGKKLPVPHCIKGTDGWQLNDRIAKVLADKSYTAVEKNTFGSVELPKLIGEKAMEEPFEAELIGLCTDICVISNALLLKAHYPEMEISVDAACRAGVSPATHQAALTAMQCCQISVKGL